MPQAVKLPDELVLEARAAATRASRSIAGQIEHWARLGRAVEASLRSPELAQLETDAAAPGARDGAALAAALTGAFSSASRREFARELRGRVTYGTDPAFPDCLVRFEPDGRRTPGRLVDRRFVPLDDGDPGARGRR